MTRFLLVNRCALCWAAIAVATIFVGTARADRDIFLASDGSKVALGAASDEPPAEADVTTRVFGRVMVANSPGPFFPDYGLEEPGVFALPVGNADIPAGYSALPANQTVTYSMLPFDVGSSTASLYYWDGSGPVSFAPAASDVSLTINPSTPMGTTASTGAFHVHPLYSLEKTVGIPADGIYLFAGSIGVTTLANSDQFFGLLLADHTVTTEDAADELLDSSVPLQSAATYVQNNLTVPEPTCFAFLATACCGLSLVRRGSRLGS